MKHPRHKRIAVIEDTVMVREVIVRHLKSFGFTPIEASDGKEGLDLIRRERPSLVLCDLRMPALDGLELLALVREEFPELPFVVMSGAGLLQDAVGALKLGAWDYIAKPIDATALEHSIHNALEKAALIQENRRQREHLELLNAELRASLRLLAEDEDAGRQIQLRMLPRDRQRFGKYLVTRDVVPSTFLSGDFIDAFAIDERHWGFYLADVSGHGVSSALVTVLLRTFVQRQVASYAETGDDLVLHPDRLLMRLNEDMTRDGLEKHLTIFYGTIDLVEDRLTYANGGHFPWPILRLGERVMALDHPGVPVGMLPSSRYEARRLTLAPRTTLCVCSDGVLGVLPQPSLEAKLEHLQRFFGQEEIDIQAARRELALDGSKPLPDDIAILIVQCGGQHGHFAGT